MTKMYRKLSKKKKKSTVCIHTYPRPPTPDLPRRFQLHDLSLYHPCTHLQAIPFLKTKALWNNTNIQPSAAAPLAASVPVQSPLFPMHPSFIGNVLTFYLFCAGEERVSYWWPHAFLYLLWLTYSITEGFLCNLVRMSPRGGGTYQPRRSRKSPHLEEPWPQTAVRSSMTGQTLRKSQS